jgi:hypothetical protein
MLGGMGELIDLDAARGHRQGRLAAAALHARMHPALRWHAGADTSTAHRRTPLGHAVCGAGGRLLLADPGTPLCDTCYPERSHREDLGA